MSVPSMHKNTFYTSGEEDISLFLSRHFDSVCCDCVALIYDVSMYTESPSFYVCPILNILLIWYLRGA